MSGVLVIAETRRGELRGVSLELIGAGRALSEQGAGPLSVALTARDGEAHVNELNLAGVREVLLVSSPLDHFEAHTAQAALRSADRAAPPRGRARRAHDRLTRLRRGRGRARAPRLCQRRDRASTWSAGGVGAVRSAERERLVLELDFPGKETVLLQLRPGAFVPASGAGTAAIARVKLDLGDRARTEQRRAA